ncbi:MULTISPECIES: reverse transcriptase domain-containing protein [Burkholderia]|uniref:reverse transcriptase domain-containing protein n=1 Tax=Burkholderia TaxID=32008 RepID=UPI00119985F2|nr:MULTISPECIES: reverse transcriptase domain-containing protein [Burkholderia]MDN7735259.1 reverse transcriptase domain-containing protein [Burkholderia gladioli]TWC60316.1 reverse transcriptase (RNA-dependent DNA polymerase) [Burkholderia sp. SJZ089]TWC94769.1 reverse transcriptase (RNA-dependent DNA polymerase) [Burkholderia sp. SJZ115]TWC96864.1 reverse transcriptase (RNA-dependent DNA polymerase) [Burkholderia sp. SJZ091]
MGALYRKVCNKRNLRRAALTVLANATSSTSENTRDEAERFKQDLERNLTDIRRQLADYRFAFAPARGIAIKKPGKTTRRPLVIAPIESRIVQRTILNVLSALPLVRSIHRMSYNLGGVLDGGVAKAIERAYRAGIKHAYYVRTDIKDFFTQVPREQLLAQITDQTGDPEFNRLLVSATAVELSNLAELKQHGDIFPLAERGVAQGSCLSPLLCNLFMHQMDEMLNTMPFEAVRYIDDVIIFGPNRSQVRKALKMLKEQLAQYGLDAYEPPARGAQRTGTEKAAEGETSRGFSFLGCDVTTDAIRPGKKARSSLIEKVRKLYATGVASQRHLKAVSGEPFSAKDDPTLLYTLWRVSNTVRAWGGAFSFCTDMRVFRHLDAELNGEYVAFRDHWKRRVKDLSQADRQRLIGVQLLEDVKFDPGFKSMVSSRAGTRRMESTNAMSANGAARNAAGEHGRGATVEGLLSTDRQDDKRHPASLKTEPLAGAQDSRGNNALDA